MAFNLFQKKSGKYLILDIGSQNTKMAVFYPKKILIEKMIMKPTPDQTFKDGFISDDGNLSDFIIQCREELELEKETEIVAGISGKGVIAKKIDIPQMDVAMIPEFVEIEAEQELFYNKDEMDLDYEILSGTHFNNPDVQSLLVITALKKTIEQYNQIIEKTEMNCKILDTNFAALFNTFMYNEQPNESQNFMLLDIGCLATNLVISIASQVVFVRNLPVAGQFFNQKIQQHMGIDYQEAEELKISAKRGEETPQDLVKLITGQINEAFLEEIQSCYELYYSLFPEKNVNQVYLTGGASQTIGLATLMQEKMKIPVQMLDSFQNIQLSPELLETHGDLKNFSSVVTGLALRSLHD